MKFALQSRQAEQVGFKSNLTETSSAVFDSLKKNNIFDLIDCHQNNKYGITSIKLVNLVKPKTFPKQCISKIYFEVY